MTVSELLHGANRASGQRRERRLAFAEYVLSRLEPAPIGVDVARAHAALWSSLVESGAMIGPHDAWIAATALANGWSLLTADEAFARVPGLDLIRL